MSDRLSPNQSPNTLDSYGGKRVNKKPLMIAGLLLMLFAGVIAYVMYLKSVDSISNKVVENAPASSNKMAWEIAGNKRGGVIDPPLQKELPPPGAGPEQKIKYEPQPLIDGEIETEQRDEALEQQIAKIRNWRWDEYKKNVVGSSTINTSAFQSGANSEQSTTISGAKTTRQKLLEKLAQAKRDAANVGKRDPVEAYKQQLAIAKASGLLNQVGSGSGSSSVLNALDNLNTGSSSNSGSSILETTEGWTLRNQVESPEEIFTLRAGFVIPGIMISGIKSELPGKIIGQVSQNVYDTPTQSYILIPQGTRIYGTYSSNVMYGQETLLVAWNRLTFPDGKVLDIEAMPGTDSAGYAGFHDLVNNHYLRIFGSALLMSGISAGMTYATNEVSDDEAFSGTLAESLADNLGEVTLEMIRKNLNIAPTLTIRPGYRFNIMVVKDMVFEGAYKNYDYLTNR